MNGTILATQATLDVETLLRPIPGDNLSGVTVRYAGVYDAIQEARRAEDELPQGEWVRPTKVADWARVITLASDALGTKSKDLQIAVWLAEALLKRHGFAGLRDGLRIIRLLHERFWVSFYPVIEEGDAESRVGPLEWLNTKLPASVRSVSVTGRSGGNNYSWLKWEESKGVDNLGRKNMEAMEVAIQEGKITGEEFEKAVSLSSREFYEALGVELTQTQDECVQLDRIVDERYGSMAPSLAEIRTAIEDCVALVEQLLKKKRPLESGPGFNNDAQTVPREALHRPDMKSTGYISNEPADRADALRRLADVAAFFRRTEPHSPVSYLVQRAILWGEMPLESWLQDVINNDDVLVRVRETLGLKQPKAE